MLRVGILLGLLTLSMVATARAADMPGAWVELTANGGLDVRALTAPGAPCPAVVADGTTLPTTTRGQPNSAYNLQVCVAHTAVGARSITVAGLPAPTLPRVVHRVVIIGDTGCRLKGKTVQACNDPASWPFARIARLAAARQPDLVIHVGDYHYRETPCPDDQPGCFGSPYGDNWAVWQKDFFDPAAPLLAVAPWVLTRGNHEECQRGGHGWFRLLDPHPDIVDCVTMTPPYALRIDTLNLLMFDGASADDFKPEADKVAQYRAQLQALLTNVPAHSWLVTHRPVWALDQEPDQPPGTTLNLTEQAAIRDLVPPTLDMVLSGHIHDFTSYDFGPSRPAQLVVGEGGDVNYAIVQPVTAGVVIDGLKLRHGYAMPNYGYVVLDRLPDGWAATAYAVTDEALVHCRLAGRALTCKPVAR